jgi:Type IIA topoisomerase (DNA gyrase/topo II, topoisomerase IV), B subunit
MASNDTETTTKSDSYGADQIKVLEGLDAVTEASGDVHRQHRCGWPPSSRL